MGRPPPRRPPEAKFIVIPARYGPFHSVPSNAVNDKDEARVLHRASPVPRPPGHEIQGAWDMMMHVYYVPFGSSMYDAALSDLGTAVL